MEKTMAAGEQVENRRVELAVLAFAATWPERFYEITELRDEHFLHPGVRKAMAIMRAAYTKSGVAAIQAMPVVVARLREHGITETDAMAILTEAMDYLPKAPEAIEGLRTVLVDSATRRAVRTLGERLPALADKVGIGSDELIAEAAKTLSEAVGKGQMLRVASMNEVMEEEVRRMERIAAGEVHEPGMGTGLMALDALMNFRRGRLTIIGARAGVGKSALLSQLIYSWVVEHGRPGVVFTLEMLKDEYAQRCLCQRAGVNIQHAINNTLSPSEMAAYRAALQEWTRHGTDWQVDDGGGITVHRLIATVRRLYHERAISWVAIDYLQLMDHGDGGKSNDTRATAVGRTSSALKALALDLKIPIIALAQLNRDLEQRTNKRPRLSDLRESGSLEQDADDVLFVYRESEHAAPDERAQFEGQPYEPAELIVAKQRNGPKGTAKVAFYRSCARFADWPEIDLS